MAEFLLRFPIAGPSIVASDEALLLMAGPDSRQAFERLVLDHLPDALRFAVRLTADAALAEDIVQEGVLKGMRHWKTYRGDAQFRTWLFRIIVNVFRDRLARLKREDALPVRLVDPKSPEPQTSALNDELGVVIAAKVAALPARQREVLVLRVYEELSPAEVADVLNISEQNVYATLHVARRRLREELAEYLQRK